MAVYKRGKNWCVRIWHEGKKIERVVGPDKPSAEAVQKKLEAERALAVAAGQPWTGLAKVQKVKRALTFGEAFHSYLSMNEVNFKPSTQQTYKDIFRSHLEKAFGLMCRFRNVSALNSVKSRQLNPESSGTKFR